MRILGYTGSAQFKKGEQFGFFPSIAAGWVPSSYAWWTEKLPWFTFPQKFVALTVS